MAAVAQDWVSRDTVVATVNGQDITLSHVIIAYATLPEQFQQYKVVPLLEDIIDQLIQKTAFSHTQTGSVPDRVVLSLENERRSLLAAKEIERVLGEAVNDADVRTAYEAEYRNGPEGEEYDAAHILVETEKEAQAIKAELDTGADFAMTAQEKSVGPSGPNGGDLGRFGQGRIAPDFETAVIALAPGEVSDPVQTQFGWHVILLKKTRPLAAPRFEAVQDEITQSFQRKAVDAHIKDLTAKADVERADLGAIDPEIIRDLDVVRN